MAKKQRVKTTSSVPPLGALVAAGLLLYGFTGALNLGFLKVSDYSGLVYPVTHSSIWGDWFSPSVRLRVVMALLGMASFLVSFLSFTRVLEKIAPTKTKWPEYFSYGLAFYFLCPLFLTRLTSAALLTPFVSFAVYAISLQPSGARVLKKSLALVPAMPPSILLAALFVKLFISPFLLIWLFPLSISQWFIPFLPLFLFLLVPLADRALLGLKSVVAVIVVNLVFLFFATTYVRFGPEIELILFFDGVRHLTEVIDVEGSLVVYPEGLARRKIPRSGVSWEDFNTMPHSRCDQVLVIRDNLLWGKRVPSDITPIIRLEPSLLDGILGEIKAFRKSARPGLTGWLDSRCVE